MRSVSPTLSRSTNPMRALPTGPVKVLYIGGCGRSGSTLLDRMLGQIPGICSLGELTHLWRALLCNQECGCGAPIRECPFWCGVGASAFDGWENVDPAEMERLRRSVVRQRYVPFMLAPGLWHAYRASFERYARVLDALYHGIQETSGAAVVVESTKHYSKAILLGRVAAVDLHVVHLVRDSRGVAFSWSKTVERPEAVHQGAYMKRYSPTRSAWRWLGYNGCFETLARLGVPSTLVRYEELVRAPRVELERILAGVGMRVGGPALSFIRGRDVHLRANHTVAGNPMRFRVGNVSLRVDDEWTRRLPAGDRRLVSLLTWPLLRRYGYRRDLARNPERAAASYASRWATSRSGAGSGERCAADGRTNGNAQPEGVEPSSFDQPLHDLGR